MRATAVVPAFFVFVVAALLVSGPEARGQGLTQVTMGGTLSYEQTLPIFASLAQGFFETEGVQIRVLTGTAGVLRSAMMAKEFDFGFFAFVHVPLARLGGSPWKAVLALHNREIFSLVVRSTLRSSVREVKDLRGKAVGFTAPGSGAWVAANVFLKRAGLDPEREVRLVPLGADPGVNYGALRTGRVDALPAWEPLTTRLLLDGLGYALVRAWSDQDQRRWYGSGRSLALALVTREDVIQRAPDLVGRVVRGTRRGLEYIRRATPERLATELMEHPRTREYFGGLARPYVVEMIRKIRGGFGDGCLSRAGFAAAMQLVMEWQLVRQPITFEEFADPRWAGACP